MMLDPMYRSWLMRQRCLCGSKPKSVERAASGMDLYVPVCKRCAKDTSYDRILTAASYLSAYVFGVEPVVYMAKQDQPRQEQPATRKEPPAAKQERPAKEKPKQTPKPELGRIGGSSQSILDEPIHTIILRWAARRIDKRPPAEWLSPMDWGDIVELARKAGSEIVEAINGKVRQTGTAL